MGNDSWGDDWARGTDRPFEDTDGGDEPTSSSVFANPNASPPGPDDWDDWDEGGVDGGTARGSGGYGPSGYDEYDDDYDDEYDADGSRRVWVSAVVVVLALLLGVGLAAVFERTGNDTDDSALDAGDGSSTSTSSSTSEVPPTIGALPGPSSTTVVDTGSSSSSSSSTTSGKPVQTSTSAKVSPPTTKKDEPPEPACASGGGGAPVPWQGEWESQWTSKPQPNDPATISICIDDVTPRVGQKVTVTLKAKDPDAVITEQECGYLLVWDGNLDNMCRDALVRSDGPRQTPAEEPGEVLVRFTHVFTKAETASVAGSVISSRWEGYRSPYSSNAEAYLKVAVHD